MIHFVMSDSSDAAVSVSWVSRQRGKKPQKNNITNINSLTEAGINTDRCFQPILTLRPSVEVASFLAGRRRNIVFTFIFLPPNTFKPLVSNSTTVSFYQDESACLEIKVDGAFYVCCWP